MLINQEGVIISDMGESPGGIFAVTAHVWTRCSCYFHILFTSRTLKNSHRGSSLLMEKSKAEETPWEKKRKKTGLKKEERVPLMKA